jgi:hypothetical protein
MDAYLGVRVGVVVRCEGGTLRDAAAYDRDGKLIRKFAGSRTSTKENFIRCVRSRKADGLYSGALEGHLSCGLVHLANISYRIGKATRPGEIRETIQSEPDFRESFDRLREHLAQNRIELDREPLILGAALTVDPQAERFTGPSADAANRLLSREYRKPFVVPDEV